MRFKDGIQWNVLSFGELNSLENANYEGFFISKDERWYACDKFWISEEFQTRTFIKFIKCSSDLIHVW